MQATIGCIFGLFVAYVAYANSIEGRPDLTPTRAILAVFLIIFSVSQFWVLLKKHATIIHLLSFPILYVIFGLIWDYASRGYIKNWEPATKNVAIQHNVFWLLILFILVALAILFTYKGRINVQGA